MFHISRTTRNPPGVCPAHATHHTSKNAFCFAKSDIKCEDRIQSDQQSCIAEVTVVRKPNQGERKKSAVYLFFLDFLVLFYQEKSTEKHFVT